MTLRLFTTFFLILGLHSSAVAQNEIAERMKAINEKFQELSDEKKKEYGEHKKRAISGHQNGKVFTCLVAINKAQAIFESDIDLLWLEGICYAEMHNVDEAIKYYEQVMKIHPQHMPTLMNLVEINYFDKRYERALHWAKVVNVLIDNFGKENDRMPLMEYKRLVCLVKLSKKDDKYKAELAKQYKRYNHMDENPYYYFANALREMDAGKKEEGLIWILKAYIIFRDPLVIESWN